jgi:hypothetical protein
MTTALALIALGAAWRLLVNFQVLNLPNFVPLAAIALFAAAKLPRRWAVVVPVALLLVSDLVIDSQHGYAFFPLSRLTNYGLFALIALGGSYLPRRLSLPSRVGASLVAATAFFLISNFMVWLGGEGLGYEPTWAGLMSCYAMGLPFFRNMLMAEVIGTVGLFGADAVLARQVEGKTAQPEPRGLRSLARRGSWGNPFAPATDLSHGVSFVGLQTPRGAVVPGLVATAPLTASGRVRDVASLPMHSLRNRSAPIQDHKLRGRPRRASVNAGLSAAVIDAAEADLCHPLRPAPR